MGCIWKGLLISELVLNLTRVEQVSWLTTCRMTENHVWCVVEKLLEYIVVVIRSFCLLHVRLLLYNWLIAEDIIKYVEWLFILLLLRLRWIIAKDVVQYVERLLSFFFLVIDLILRWVLILALVLGLILLISATEDLVEGQEVSYCWFCFLYWWLRLGCRALL